MMIMTSLIMINSVPHLFTLDEIAQFGQKIDEYYFFIFFFIFQAFFRILWMGIGSQTDPDPKNSKKRQIFEVDR